MENLYLYEKVLLFLGIFLFLILSGGLVYYIVKKQEIKKLFLFFILPIIMIAYPSIQEIIIQDGIVNIKKYKEQVQNNPNSEEAKQDLEKAILELEPRAESNEKIAQEVSEAYILLEKPDRAIDMSNEILRFENQSNNKVFLEIKEAAMLQKEIIENPKDSIRIKENINKVSPLKKAYFEKKYLPIKRAY